MPPILILPGLKEGAGQKPAFSGYFRRTKDEYQKLSPAPDKLSAFYEQFDKMEDTEPHFSDDQLRRIKVPTWIVDGDRDEVIKREDTDHMAVVIPVRRTDSAKCQPFRSSTRPEAIQ